MGDVVTLTQDVEDFSRIAAQIAKQVLIQKVRGIERENFYKEFKPREGEVITGSVRRFSDRDLIVDLGKVEAILPYCEQIKKERYTNGSRVKAVITKVLNQTDLANIGDDPVLSRYKSERDTNIVIEKTEVGSLLTCKVTNNNAVLFSFQLLLPNDSQAEALKNAGISEWADSDGNIRKWLIMENKDF